jgi:hypothetical protein
VELPEKVVLYLDLLGFSALTEQNPHLYLWRYEDSGQPTLSASPSQLVFAAFHRILDVHLGYQTESRARSENDVEKAMIFSDCAVFVFSGTSAPDAALWAIYLMHEFLMYGVPVRMGLARGTCYAIRFTSEQSERFAVTRSIFAGTAVVRAVAAEGSGKGMRIFLHPSLKDDFQYHRFVYSDDLKQWVVDEQPFDEDRAADYEWTHPYLRPIELEPKSHTADRELCYLSDTDWECGCEDLQHLGLNSEYDQFGEPMSPKVDSESYSEAPDLPNRNYDREQEIHDRQLFHAVELIRRANEAPLSAAAEQHYTQTYEALNRMRDCLSRDQLHLLPDTSEIRFVSRRAAEPTKRTKVPASSKGDPGHDIPY